MYLSSQLTCFFWEEYFSSVKGNRFDLDQIFVYLEFVNVLYFV